MTDPTITIAGLRARINSLLSAVQHSNRTTAERVTMFVEASSNADRLTAERDALAAELAQVRAAADAAALLHQQATTAYEGERGEVARLREERDQLRATITSYQAAAVAIADALADDGGLGPVDDDQASRDAAFLRFAEGLARRAAKVRTCSAARAGATPQRLTTATDCCDPP